MKVIYLTVISRVSAAAVDIIINTIMLHQIKYLQIFFHLYQTNIRFGGKACKVLTGYHVHFIPVRGYQAAPLVMPLLNVGVPALHATPWFIDGWFLE